MKFSEKLNDFIEQLSCTGKDICNLSGISAASLSRYRNGERVPELGTKPFEDLCCALAQISAQKGKLQITADAVKKAFVSCDDFVSTDKELLRKNFNTLLSALNVNLTQLCQYTNYDASAIFRIRNGSRKPGDAERFASAVASFVTRTMQMPSEIAALSGEAVAGYHSDGKYYLTKVKREVEYYRKRAEEMLKNAYPLMEIYRSERKNELNAFLLADTKTAGKRRSILSSLPLYTISSKLLDRILTRNNINAELKEKIKEYAKTQRQRIKIILENERIEDEIPDFVQENFTKSPPMLELSGIFCEEDIPYNEEEYTAHLKESMAFAEQNPNYTLKCSTAHAFHNLKIIIHEGQWVMVSKGKTPAIHFVIRHPKLRSAIECFIPPITEDE